MHFAASWLKVGGLQDGNVKADFLGAFETAVHLANLNHSLVTRNHQLPVFYCRGSGKALFLKLSIEIKALVSKTGDNSDHNCIHIIQISMIDGEFHINCWSFFRLAPTRYNYLPRLAPIKQSVYLMAGLCMCR